MTNSFEKNIENMLSGRKITPWGEKIGLNKGTTGRMKKGTVPGHQILNLIQKVENVSTAWLVDGVGRPFITHEVSSDAEGAEYLLALLDEHDWEIFVFYNEVSFCCVLTQAAVFDFKGKDIRYAVIEVITGVLGEQCALILKAQKDMVSYALVDNKTISLINHGEVGTFKILGDEHHDGFVNLCDVMHDDHELPINNKRDNTMLLAKFNQLKSAEKKQIEGLIDSLLKN